MKSIDVRDYIDLRDCFAATALAAYQDQRMSFSESAEMAYEQADAMMKAGEMMGETRGLIEEQIKLNRGMMEFEREILQLEINKINMIRVLTVIRDACNRASDEGVEAARLRGALKKIWQESVKALAGAAR